MIVEYLRQLSFSFFNTPPQKTVVSPSRNKISEDPDLKIIWNKLIDQYFNADPELKKYKVVWSGRSQKRVLASCNIYSKVVRVAPAMKFGDAPLFIEPLLYHELCHAVVGFITVGRKRVFHSRQFRAQEARHPQIELLNQWIKLGGWTKSVRISKRNTTKRPSKSY